MPAPAASVDNNKGYQYEVSWNDESIGLIKDVDPSGLKPKSVEQKIGQWNDILVNRHLRGGVEGTIKMTLHETVAARLRQLMPWAPSSGSFAISPGVASFDCYAASKELRLHPVGVVGTTDDLVFLHAFPTMIALPKSAGNDMQSVAAEFEIYPDRATLPLPVYGYVGEPPST